MLPLLLAKITFPQVVPIAVVVAVVVGVVVAAVGVVY